ncbi:MAG: family 78 glycoside hydrolase catalytic domain, partial [Kiritimatiellaeota bacterium]|nr:family 78 glycoside hydrolase catalytic domain [Kiritimatiellota bacterium]
MDKISREISRDAYWIGRSDTMMSDWRAKVKPAPLFRREFTLGAKPVSATLRVCGLGFHEARVNGAKVGDHVLDPVPTQYDVRTRYVTHDITAMLRKGANAVGVMLGNGWYNCHTAEVWHFDKASWRDYPKLLLQLDITLANGKSVRVCSDPEWRFAEGPVRFDALRNGEFYDAREERPGWDAPGFDDSAWARAIIVPGPGGALEEQTAPPCKVFETIKPVCGVGRVVRPGVTLFDFGVNIAGWVRLTAKGEAGREVVLRYGERVNEAGELDQKSISGLIMAGEIQTDRYTFKGGATETWEPRFTYHGFQYVQAENLPPGATLEARVVRSAFAEAGSIETSDETLNKLVEITLRAYRSNFVGIPTDCPHREKNGWTGDAQLASHTGIFA